jgi:PII-like signaling protein
MQGYQIIFFTQQDRTHAGKPLCEWLICLARELGLPGATLFAAAEGYGHSGKLHSAHFFELADQPQAILMLATEEQADLLFASIRAEQLQLFYVKSAAEFGSFGKELQ